MSPPLAVAQPVRQPRLVQLLQDLHAAADLAETTRREAGAAPEGLRAIALAALTDGAASAANLGFLARLIDTHADDLARAGFLCRAAAAHLIATTLRTSADARTRGTPDVRLHQQDH